MTISQGILDWLVTGPKTVDQLVKLMFVPRAHIRAAVSELLHVDRKITCNKEGQFVLGEPSIDFPVVKKRN